MIEKNLRSFARVKVLLILFLLVAIVLGPLTFLVNGVNVTSSGFLAVSSGVQASHTVDTIGRESSPLQNPGSNTIYATKDNYLYEDQKTGNYGSLTWIATSGFDVAYPQRGRSIIEFDTSAIPVGVTITSASLGLYYYNEFGENMYGVGIRLTRVRRADWEELQSTWNIYKTGSNWGTEGADNTSTDIDTFVTLDAVVPYNYGWMYWTGASMISFVNDAILNRGNELILRLHQLGTTQGYAQFYSKDNGSLIPKLYVEYTEVVPTVTTQAPTDIATTNATGNGDITDLGGEPNCDLRGFVWDTASHGTPGDVAPTATDYYLSPTGDGDYVEAAGNFSTGAFTNTLDVLTVATTYYVRAYAQSAAGYSYGNQITFKTPNKYAYKQEIVITEVDNAGSDYQVLLIVHSGVGTDSTNTIYLDNHCNTFPMDLIVTTDDEETPEAIFIEDLYADPINLWVKVTADVATTPSIFLFYGSSEKISSSDITGTFVTGDHFETTSIGSDWSFTSEGYTPIDPHLAISGTSFRNNPNAVRYQGNHDRTYFTWFANYEDSGPDGSIRISFYDHDTKRFESSKMGVQVAGGISQEAHYASSIHVIESGTEKGKILVFSQGLATGTGGSRRSANPEDITGTWGSTKLITSYRSLYLQPIELDNGDIYCFATRVEIDFFRMSNTCSKYSSATDTWETETELVQFSDNHWTYQSVSTNGTEVHLFLNDFDAVQGDYKNVYHMYTTDMITWEKMNGTAITLPATQYTIDIAASNSYYFLTDSNVDSSGIPCVTYTRVPTTGTTGGAYYTFWDDTYQTWRTKLVATVKAWNSGSVPGAFNSAISIDHSSPLVVYTGEVVGATTEITEHTLSARTAAGSFSRTDYITSNSLSDQGVPYVVRNYHDEFKLTWTSVHYWTTSANWQATLCGSIGRTSDIALLGASSPNTILDGTTTWTPENHAVKYRFNIGDESAYVMYLAQRYGITNFEDSAVLFGWDDDATHFLCGDGGNYGPASGYWWNPRNWQTGEIRQTGTGAGALAWLYIDETERVAITDDTVISDLDMHLYLKSAEVLGENCFVDWVFVRNFVENEPTVAPGAETTLFSNTPTSQAFSMTRLGESTNTTINYFTVTNSGTGAIDVLIRGTDLTGGGTTWSLSSIGVQGVDIYSMCAGLDDGDDLFDVIVKKWQPYNQLIDGLAQSATQDWGLKIYTPTSLLATYAGQQMTSTLTIICSSDD